MKDRLKRAKERYKNNKTEYCPNRFLQSKAYKRLLGSSRPSIDLDHCTEESIEETLALKREKKLSPAEEREKFLSKLRHISNSAGADTDKAFNTVLEKLREDTMEMEILNQQSIFL